MNHHPTGYTIRKYPHVGYRQNLEKLPRTLLIAAGRDILACQGKEFIDRITSLGVNATRLEFPSAVHLFITVPGQETAFNEAVKYTVEFLGK